MRKLTAARGAVIISRLGTAITSFASFRSVRLLVGEGRKSENLSHRVALGNVDGGARPLPLSIERGVNVRSQLTARNIGNYSAVNEKGRRAGYS
jgi:hypothetical protein